MLDRFAHRFSLTSQSFASRSLVVMLLIGVSLPPATCAGKESPRISALSPTSGQVGTVVKITGSNFGSTQGTGHVSFNGTTATVESWSASSIAAPVPAGATTGDVVVTVGHDTSNGVKFTVRVAVPNITNLSPAAGGPVYTVVTITGTNFGATQGTSKVSFGGTPAVVHSWSASSIVVPVPPGTTAGNAIVIVTVGGQVSSGANFDVTASSALPTLSQVLGAIDVVNDYWIANNPTPANNNWDQATYFTGDLAAYDATGAPNYLSFAQSWASEYNYSLEGGNTTNYPDYQAAGQVYIRLYQLTGAASDLTGITESLNGMVTSGVNNEWTWIDAINMSMPDFAELGSIDNNQNYYSTMYPLYTYPKDTLGLFNPAVGLWWRDSTFVGSATYWSRGNGWVFAALAKVLSVLPKSDPHYQEYLNDFLAMATALAVRQQPGGYWNSDLGGTDFAGPETSGTSLFLYGFAWGLNNGILPKSTYLPVVENAWNFLVKTAIQTSPNTGLLGYVQPGDVGPDPTTATTTEDFGVGAFLLAARQMALLPWLAN